MPAARATLKRCTCAECTVNNPKGLLFDSRALTLHLQRVRSEQSRPVDGFPHLSGPLGSDPSHSGRSSRCEEICGRVFALTITDDGPDQTSSSSKLWNTREEFQSKCSSTPLVDGSTRSLSVSDIADTLGRLTLPDQTPTPPESQFDQSTDIYAAFGDLSISPASIVGGRRVAMTKKERNSTSLRALQRLTNIQSRAQRCLRLLLDSSDCATELSIMDVATLRQATENIKRDTEAINSRKEAIHDLLTEIEQVIADRASSGNDSLTPLEVNTGMSQYRSP